MKRNTISASFYLVLVIVAISSKLWPYSFAREIVITLTVLFLVLEFGKAPALQRNVGALIFGVGALCAWAGGDLVGGLMDGLEKSQIFIVMFFAVSWLREPAVTSPTLRTLRDAVVAQPAGRRYPILWLSSHFLGSVLNLAAMSLLSSMAGEQSDRRLRKRLSIALMMGFTTASTWGPFYVSIAVVLSAIPSVRWIDIAPLGFMLSMVLLCVGWIYDRVFLRENPVATSQRSGVPLTVMTVGRAALLLGLLIFLVMGAHEIVGLDIPIALGVIAPPFAIAWAAVQVESKSRWSAGARPLIRRIFSNLPELRNEAIAFVAASVLGVGVSRVLPPEKISTALNGVGVGEDIVVIGIIGVMTLAGAVGLHPVILVILVSEVMPPEVIGIAPEVLAMALLGVWGTSTMVSPFSATTLFMARVVNLPSHVIAWRWGMPVVFISACVVAAYVVMIRHVLYP
ncbi:MAG: hypothetical protein WD075_04790 [Rhodospirillales bacterium]